MNNNRPASAPNKAIASRDDLEREIDDVIDNEPSGLRFLRSLFLDPFIEFEAFE